MASFHSTLLIKKGACPLGCNNCITACASRNKGKNSGPVIKVVNESTKKSRTVATCFQCSDPDCLKACPSDAISKNENDGIVRIDAEQCTGCEACIDACPYGAIYFNADKQIANKCDKCNGKPVCVDACPYGVISHAEAHPIYKKLKEDIVPTGTGLCVGCGAEFAFRFMLRVLAAKDLIVYGCPSCMLPVIFSSVRAPSISSLMTTVPSFMTGASRYFNKVGKDATLLAFVGDGCSADIGFQPLSAAAERGEKIIYVCYDNEGYQNTGIQRSSTTPYGAWTMTTQIGVNGSGKTQQAKDISLLMAMHGIPYAATISLANLDDFAAKVTKAKNAVKEGFVYLHIFAPCPPGWKYQPEDTIKLSRLSVETNVFPLWEAEKGKFRFTHKPKFVTPLAEYIKLQGRFDHMTIKQVEEFQKVVDQKLAIMQKLAS